MGVDVDPSRDVVPPFTLGVTDTNPLTMAGAYATFAARGKHCDAATGHRGAEQPPARPSRTTRKQCKQVLPHRRRRRGQRHPARRAGAGNGFGATAGLALNQPSAGKTGTTNDNQAVWFDRLHARTWRPRR